MDMANFKDTLEKDVSEIKTKIRKINMSLRGIEYDAGTYIEINHDNSQDIEIRQFQIQLRESIEHTIGETDVFNEQKFERVKTILDRFNGGAQVDITWTNKVTDVRNWLDFSAARRMPKTTRLRTSTAILPVNRAEKERNWHTLSLLQHWHSSLAWNGTSSSPDRSASL